MNPVRTPVRRLFSRPRMMQLVMWAAAALLPVASAAAQQGGTVAATATVRNRAVATVALPGGGVATSRDSATVAVSYLAGVGLSPATTGEVRPAGSVVLAHRLANTGTRTDRITITATVPGGWTVALYADVDGDGAIGAGDTLVTVATIAPGASLALLARVTAPPDAPDSSSAALRLHARSGNAPAATADVEDAITVVGPRAELRLEKHASRGAAAHGDTITFTLTLRNDGDAPADTATIVDSLPTGMRYIAGSLSRDGTSLPDADAALTDGPRTTIRVPVPPLAPGAATAVSFRVVVATGASADSLVNVAAATQQGAAGAMGRAALAIRLAEIELEKQVVGDTLVALGGELTYRLRGTNRSADATAYDVVLVDTLPAALRLVTAEASPEVSGGVLTWRVPSLAPGETITRDLTVRVVAVPDGPLVNHASLGALNAAAVSGATALAVVDATPGAALGLTKRAGVLEVGLGEAVPYVLTLRNQSPIPLHGIVLQDVLPEGMTLGGREVRGADSIHVAGRTVTMFVAGPLASNADHVLRYNGLLTSARGRTAANVAIASAESGRVLSDTAVAVVRVRRGFEVENRTLVGKVWLDRNDDGRQEPGETGVAGMTVWMADGVSVVTDREGRFSLRDVPVGRHALRLDMAGVPAGMRLADADDDVRIVRADGWTLPAVEFRLVPGPGAKPCDCPDTLALPRAPVAAVQQGSGGTAAMNAAERATEELVLGPAARFTTPTDAAVVHASRIYVGARGEANVPVRLLVGDSVVAEGVIRPDGLHDFLNVPLAPGPHTLRLWSRNSWGKERWDTLRVHRSGPVASFALASDAQGLHPAERGEAPVRIRVLDQWGMPVAEGVQVTVEATGATVESEDTDRASLGVQRTVMKDGWLSVGMRGGATTGPATVKLRSGAARGSVTVPVLPRLRPMLLTGSAEIGLGATTPSYGAVSARGTLDDRTAVTVAWDSRRHGDDAAFGRVVDPLGASQYPTLGDGSSQTSHGTGSGTLTARVERNYDWLEFGDITPRDVTGSRALFDYRRALTGVQGRVTMGAVTVQGFGSFTSQQLQQRQIPATNGSGPYDLGSDLRPGTERIVVEVRARDNAARVIDRRELTRVVDYELDHVTGALLLRRPLASMDGAGNPVFIVAYAERAAGGDARLVGGGRAELGIARPLGRGVFDSVAVGVSAVHDANGGAASAVLPTSAGAASSLDVVGTDLHLERGTTSLELAVLRSEQRDTAAFATRGALAWESGDARRSAGAEWTRVAAGFGGGADPRLASGFRELRLRAGARVGSHARLELVHERQYFEEYGIDRRSTFLRAEQRRGDRSLSQQLGLQRDGTRAGALQGSTTTGQGRLEAAMGDRGSLWLEATRPLERTGASLQPSRLGMGAGYRVFGRTRLEATHFLNQVEGGQDYSTSGVNLRTETPFGGRAWGGVERANAVRSSHAALLGIEQRFRLSHGWEVNGMFERRLGLDAAPLEDPARSLPFVQPEQDRSLAAFGVGFMPGADRSRLSLRSEFTVGVERRGFRVTMAGDVPLGPDAALLARSDWSESEYRLRGAMHSRQDRSLLGYAFRPTRSVALNVLAKVEWRRSMNPLGSTSLADSADARRLIATSDAVWTPLPRTELAARYAVRWADWRYAGQDAPVAPVTHYTGLRGERGLTGRLGARVDARLLREQATGVATWSVAPSLTYRLTHELRLEAGYRAGTLQDLDFGESRSKLFATLGLHFTERTLGSAAGFWRDRVRGDRQE